MATTVQQATAEFVGTFFLVFVGVMAIMSFDLIDPAGNNLLAIAAAHGLALGVAVSATMGISGGQLNPAVTFALLVTRRIAPKQAAVNVAAQLAAGVLAAGIAAWVFLGLADAAPLNWPVLSHTNIGATRGVLDGPKAVVVELVLTFLLVFTVFGTAVDPRSKGRIMGLGIGLAVFFDILAGGPLTGASMNPARTFGPDLVLAFTPMGTDWARHWIYWVGPLAGAAIAGLLYDKVLMEKT